MLAVLSPGQGSQKPGFLAPWLDLPGARDRLAEWSTL
ncbi:ACP S-malonyltransferase, partial [Micromonospora zhanjiangensis]